MSRVSRALREIDARRVTEPAVAAARHSVNLLGAYALSRREGGGAAAGGGRGRHRGRWLSGLVVVIGLLGGAFWGAQRGWDGGRWRAGLEVPQPAERVAQVQLLSPVVPSPPAEAEEKPALARATEPAALPTDQPGQGDDTVVVALSEAVAQKVDDGRQADRPGLLPQASLAAPAPAPPQAAQHSQDGQASGVASPQGSAPGRGVFGASQPQPSQQPSKSQSRLRPADSAAGQSAQPKQRAGADRVAKAQAKSARAGVPGAGRSAARGKSRVETAPRSARARPGAEPARSQSITPPTRAAARAGRAPEAASSGAADAPAGPGEAGAVQVRPRTESVEALQAQARAALAAGETQEAVQYLRSALRQDPMAHTARQALLAVLARGERGPAWLAALTEAAAVDPARFGLMAARGLGEAGHVDEAMQVLTAVPSAARQTDWYATHGLMAQRLGQHDRAIESLSRALDRAGPMAAQRPALRIALAESLSARGELELARQHLTELLATEAMSPTLRAVATRRLQSLR